MSGQMKIMRRLATVFAALMVSTLTVGAAIAPASTSTISA